MPEFEFQKPKNLFVLRNLHLQGARISNADVSLDFVATAHQKSVALMRRRQLFLPPGVAAQQLEEFCDALVHDIE